MFEKKLAVTICDAASMLSMSELTLRRKIWAGEVRAQKVGGKVLVPIDEVRRLVGLSATRPKRHRRRTRTAE